MVKLATPVSHLFKNMNYEGVILKNSDPIAKWLGLKSGDIVEIDRYNPNSGLTKYYRACV